MGTSMESKIAYSLLRDYIVKNYGEQITSPQVGNVTRSYINKYFETNILNKDSQSYDEKLTIALKKIYGKNHQFCENDFRSWERFLKGITNDLTPWIFNAMCMAFKVPGYKDMLDLPQNKNEIENHSEEQTPICFVGYYYSSFKYKLSKCILEINGESVLLTYMGNNKSYSGIINNGFSIELVKEEAGIIRHSKILLSDNLHNYDLLSGIWIKHHKPYGEDKYETMGYVLFERIDSKENAAFHNMPIAKLAKVSGWRFDKLPIHINQQNERIDEQGLFRYKLENIIGTYELYQILLNRSVEDYKYFSRLKLEITKNLEIILHETKEEKTSDGKRKYRTREGFFIEHPIKDDSIILHFPPNLSTNFSSEFMTIMFQLNDNSTMKGVIAETFGGYPHCGAIYLKRTDKDFKPKRMSIEEVFSSIYDKKDDYPEFMEFFVGYDESNQRKNNRVVPYIHLSELYKYKKLIDDTYFNIDINRIKYVLFDLTGTIVDMLNLDRAILDYLCRKHRGRSYEDVNKERNHGFSLEQNIKKVFFEKNGDNVFEEYNEYITKRLNDEYISLGGGYEEIEKDINNFTFEAFSSIKRTFSILKSRGIKIAIVSNRRKPLLNAILEKIKINNIISYSAPDDLDGEKPNANILSELMLKIEEEGSEINENEILFIGDTQEDFECADKIGCHFMFYMGKLSSSQLEFFFYKSNDKNKICKVRTYDEFNKIINAQN